MSNSTDIMSNGTTGTVINMIDPYLLPFDNYIYLITVPAMTFDLLVLGLCLYVWISFRNTGNPFVRSRTSSFVIFFLRVSMTLVTLYQFIISVVEVPCIGLIWTDNFILGTFFWAILLDSLRMFVLFNWTQNKFKNFDDQEDDLVINPDQKKTITKRKEPWWRNKKFVSNSSLVKIFIICQSCYALIPLVYTVYFLATKDDTQCPNVLYIVDFGLVAIAAIGGIILAIQMRNVHDAYFLKNSLKAIGIIGIVYGIPSVLIEVLSIIPSNWFQASVLPAYTMVEFVYFAIPAYKAIKWEKHTNSDVNSGTTIGTESVANIDNESSKGDDIESGIVGGHIKNAKLHSYLTDELSLEFIQEFLIHYQMNDCSDYLKFWFKLKTFKDIKTSALLAGNASLIYQKFLKDGAYIYIDLFSNEQREKANAKIDYAMNNTTDIEIEIFDDMYEILEQELTTRMFEPFLNSEYFKKLQEKKGLDNIVEMKVTKRSK